MTSRSATRMWVLRVSPNILPDILSAPATHSLANRSPTTNQRTSEEQTVQEASEERSRLRIFFSFDFFVENSLRKSPGKNPRDDTTSDPVRRPAIWKSARKLERGTVPWGCAAHISTDARATPLPPPSPPPYWNLAPGVVSFFNKVRVLLARRCPRRRGSGICGVTPVHFKANLRRRSRFWGAATWRDGER